MRFFLQEGKEGLPEKIRPEKGSVQIDAERSFHIRFADGADSMILSILRVQQFLPSQGLKVSMSELSTMIGSQMFGGSVKWRPNHDRVKVGRAHPEM